LEEFLLNRRRRQTSGAKVVSKFLVYLFAVVGLIGTVIGAYQYKKFTALYSLANVLSATESVDMTVRLGREGLQDRHLTSNEAVDGLKSAMSELGVKAKVHVR
jgi:hypothetical protein